ncbi:hypothetical protein K438DRAFT_1844370 [Mycena galopus ATCC 62051]|nr:hypothetical protein K438DRAFT_1844370 [Mycena galopus ATCC 62051]
MGSGGKCSDSDPKRSALRAEPADRSGIEESASREQRKRRSVKSLRRTHRHNFIKRVISTPSHAKLTV